MNAGVLRECETGLGQRCVGGFSLVEVLVALLLLAVAVLGLAQAQFSAGTAAKEAMQRVRAIDAARDWLAVFGADPDHAAIYRAVRLDDAPASVASLCVGDPACRVARWKCGFARWRERCDTASSALLPLDGGVEEGGEPAVVVRYGPADSATAFEVRLPLMIDGG